MSKPREFWVQRTPVTEGKKVVEKFTLYTELSAQLHSDEYHHGDEIIHVREVTAEDHAKDVALRAALDDLIDTNSLPINCKFCEAEFICDTCELIYLISSALGMDSSEGIKSDED